MPGDNRVLIIGGGWAGMAAALELSRHHIPVTLFESARQLGGRARNVVHGGQHLDNGQHLLIGAYSETLRLLQQMGIREADVLKREQLSLHVRGLAHSLELKAPPLPAPLHLVWALLTAKGVGYRDKLQALRMSLNLSLSGFSLAQDISVAELLHHHRQGEALIRDFWAPLCIATLNTPVAQASAQVFLRVLKDSFSKRKRDSDLLIPRVPLGSLFPEAAVDYLSRQKHSTVHLQERVRGLEITNEGISGLQTNAQHYNARDVILAVSPSAAERLLAPHVVLAPLAENIAQLGSQPIITVYLQYPASHRLPQTMLGMSGTLSQWLFDRSLCGQPGLVAVVISAEGTHMGWDNERLISTVTTELRSHFPLWPEVEQATVIREKRATFGCRVGCEPLRPGNRTPVQGLWLAGDYTDTGYPATLEGAVRSGVQCAHRIIEQRQPSPTNTMG